MGSGIPSGATANAAEGLEFESRVTTTNTVVHGLTPYTNYRWEGFYGCLFILQIITK